MTRGLGISSLLEQLSPFKRGFVAIAVIRGAAPAGRRPGASGRDGAGCGRAQRRLACGGPRATMARPGGADNGARPRRSTVMVDLVSMEFEPEKSDVVEADGHEVDPDSPRDEERKST